MKIIYLAILGDLDSYAGVIKKIRNQTQALKRSGLDINTYVFYTSGLKDEHISDIQFVYYKYPEKKIPLTGFFLDTIFRRHIFKKIYNIVKSEDYNVIYFRYPLSDYYSYRFLKKNRGRIIFEHNTKELQEIRAFYDKSILNKIKEVIFTSREKTFAKLSFKYLGGLVGCSKDFVEHQWEKVGYKIENYVSISNGIDVNKIKIRTAPEFDEKFINILFVANVSPWHGFDRLIKGFKNYKGSIIFNFYLLGDKLLFQKEILKCDLTEDKLNAFHLEGFLDNEQLDEYFNKCHIAVGSLGLHRLGIKNGVPLKNREYLAHGIPFIYSGEDEDISVHSCIHQYILNVKDDESELDFDEVVRFVCILSKDKNHPSILRDYSYRNVDMSVKMGELASFINKVNGSLSYSNSNNNM